MHGSEIEPNLKVFFNIVDRDFALHTNGPGYKSSTLYDPTRFGTESKCALTIVRYWPKDVYHKFERA